MFGRNLACLMGRHTLPEQNSVLVMRCHLSHALSLPYRVANIRERARDYYVVSVVFVVGSDEVCLFAGTMVNELPREMATGGVDLMCSLSYYQKAKCLNVAVSHRRDDGKRHLVVELFLTSRKKML